METLTTKGIRISVQHKYREEYSKPIEDRYIFSYQVTIENTSSQTVQLLRRHWHICDAAGTCREVEGVGVIGKQPILAPGETHTYESWSPLPTTIGKMIGSYLMIQLSDKKSFRVRIPEIRLIAPFILC